MAHLSSIFLFCMSNLLHFCSITSISPAGYSVAAGEFNGDDEEGEGHIYCTEKWNSWWRTESSNPDFKLTSSLMFDSSVWTHLVMLYWAFVVKDPKTSKAKLTSIFVVVVVGSQSLSSVSQFVALVPFYISSSGDNINSHCFFLLQISSQESPKDSCCMV